MDFENGYILWGGVKFKGSDSSKNAIQLVKKMKKQTFVFKEGSKNMEPSLNGGKAKYVFHLNLHIFWGCSYPPPKPQLASALHNSYVPPTQMVLAQF